MTRRFRALIGLLSLALLAALAACGGSSGSADPSTSPSVAAGPFSFTDDRGVKVELPAKPQRIVVQSSVGAALWDFGVRPVGIFGPQKLSGGKPDPQVGNIDLATVTSLGENYGEFNVEKLAELQPDLIITSVYSDILWYIPEKAQSSIEKMAPIVGMKLEGLSIPDGIAKFEALAKEIGADPVAAGAPEAKQRFEAASTRFSSVVKAKPDMSVVSVSGYEDNFYVGDPSYLGGLKYMVQLGMIHPKTDGDGGAWEALSWEQVGRYPADVFLVDDRTASVTTMFEKKASWQALPAVKAGQDYPWNPEIPYSYDLFAKELDRLAGLFETARTDLVK